MISFLIPQKVALLATRPIVQKVLYIVAFKKG